MTDTEIEWLSTKDAAKRLGITTRTLYRFIDEGDLPAYRMGRVIRIKQTDVDAFTETRRIEPGTLSYLYPDPAPMRLVEGAKDKGAKDKGAKDKGSGGDAGADS